MRKATHLVKVWFFIDSDEPDEDIKGRILEKFSFLGDSLENIEIIPLTSRKERFGWKE